MMVTIPIYALLIALATAFVIGKISPMTRVRSRQAPQSISPHIQYGTSTRPPYLSVSGSDAGPTARELCQRASDADRNHQQAILDHALMEGRLEADEYEARSREVKRARTVGELDLPTAGLRADAPRLPRHVISGSADELSSTD